MRMQGVEVSMSAVLNPLPPQLIMRMDSSGR
jgi:hypothetical protein